MALGDQQQIQRQLETSTFLTFRDVFNNIPSFNGKNIPFEQFARPCRHAAKMVPDETMADFLNMLHLKLTGEAADITETKTYLDIETLLKDLKDYFEKPYELSDLESELKSNVQNYNEPVKTYSARTRKIVKRISDRLNEVYKTPAQEPYLTNRINEANKAAIKAYIRGLSDQIGNLLMHKTWQSIDEAISAAESVEMELLRRQEVHQGKKSEIKTQAKVRFTSIVDELDDIVADQSDVKFCDIHGKNRTHKTADCYTVLRARDGLEDRRRGRDRSNSRNNQNNWGGRRNRDNSRDYSRGDAQGPRDNSRNRNPRNYNGDRSRNPNDSRGRQRYRSDRDYSRDRYDRDYSRGRPDRDYSRGRPERDYSRDRNDSRDRSGSWNRGNFRDSNNSRQRSQSQDRYSRDNSRDRGNHNPRNTGIDLSQIEQALQNVLKKNPNTTSRNSATGGQD